jgi:hypothetical protein
VRLLLESTLRLDGQLGGHFCENSVRRGTGSSWVRDSSRRKGGCRSVRLSTSILDDCKFSDGGQFKCGRCATAALVPDLDSVRIG